MWSETFCEAATTEFGYLADLGFKVCRRKATEAAADVEFAAPLGFVVSVFAYLPRIDWGVGACGSGLGEFTSLAEIEELYPGVTAEPYVCGIHEASTDPAKTRVLVGQMAERFRRAGVPFLQDANRWRLVETLRKSLRRKEEVARVDREVAKAFADERWVAVDDLVRSMGSDASPLNLKRALYARKRMYTR